MNSEEDKIIFHPLTLISYMFKNPIEKFVSLHALKCVLFVLFTICSQFLLGQKADSMRTEFMFIDGQRVKALITETDTLLLAEIDSVQISSPRKFDSREDYITYLKYKKYAAKVYPYAKSAVKIYREAEYVTRMMDKKSRKHHLKRLQKELEDNFEKPLKKLTKTQGRILVEMIEKELEMPLYDLIKETRGTFLASYYTGIGAMFTYNLREGYIEGKDEMMDIVLQDFDVSHDVERLIQKYQQERLPMIPNQL
ncbi:MAG: DUF4294 domain-containing protein [Bacteroidetes bacterium]|jgi:hypothetical protein|nr:DUF4294 domain-containing protein [Bacteroidota bacterium]